MKLYKRHWLIKQDPKDNRYIFIYHYHSRVAYITSGKIGEAGQNYKLSSENLKPIENMLNQFIAEKKSEGYVSLSGREMWVDFDFSFLKSKFKDQLQLEDELWDVMDALNEEMYEIGLSANEGWIDDLDDKMVVRLALFNRVKALPFIKKHFGAYANARGFEMRDKIEEQLVGDFLILMHP